MAAQVATVARSETAELVVPAVRRIGSRRLQRQQVGRVASAVLAAQPQVMVALVERVEQQTRFTRSERSQLVVQEEKAVPRLRATAAPVESVVRR